MKNVLYLFLMSNSIAHSSVNEMRIYNKVNPKTAVISIQTEEKESTQAANYLDGKENERFIAELVNDKNSDLYKIKMKKEACLTKNELP